MKNTRDVELTERQLQRVINDAIICAAGLKLLASPALAVHRRGIAAADRILNRFVHRVSGWSLFSARLIFLSHFRRRRRKERTEVRDASRTSRNQLLTW